MTTEETTTVPASQVRDLIAGGTWSHETIGKPGARESVHLLKLGAYVTYPVFCAVRDQVARLGGHYVKRERGFAFPVARPTFPNGWTQDGREVVAAWLASDDATTGAEPVADAEPTGILTYTPGPGSIADRLTGAPVWTPENGWADAPAAEPVAPAAPTVTDVPADWSGAVERLDTVEVRKAVTEALRAYFPGVKFS